MTRKQKNKLTTIGRKLVQLRDTIKDKMENDLICSALTDLEQIVGCRQQPQYSQDTLVKLKSLYDMGVSYKHINVVLGVSRDTIRRAARKHGWQPRYRLVGDVYATKLKQSEQVFKS